MQRSFFVQILFEIVLQIREALYVLCEFNIIYIIGHKIIIFIILCFSHTRRLFCSSNLPHMRY